MAAGQEWHLEILAIVSRNRRLILTGFSSENKTYRKLFAAQVDHKGLPDYGARGGVRLLGHLAAHMLVHHELVHRRWQGGAHLDEVRFLAVLRVSLGDIAITAGLTRERPLCSVSGHRVWRPLRSESAKRTVGRCRIGDFSVKVD